MTNELREQLKDRINWEKGFPPAIGVGDGWLPIIDELDNAIRKVKESYRVAQIKQKFGGLRVYTDSDEVAVIAELIRAAEVKAQVTCEECGNLGRQTSVGYWHCVLCPDCEKVLQERAAERRAALLPNDKEI